MRVNGSVKLAKFEKFEPTAVSVMLEAGFKPMEPYKGSNIDWLCKCLTCNNEFYARYIRVKMGSFKTCPNCRSLEKADFSAEASKIMVSANLTPLEEYSGRNYQPWKCKCNLCGNIVTPSFQSVNAGNGGCRYCGQKDSIEARTLDGAIAEAFMRQNNLEPMEPYKSARAKWKCRCTVCNSIVFPTYNAIQQGEGGCQTCGRKNRAIKMRKNESLARELMHEKGLEPLEPYKSGNDPWKSRCLQCGEIVNPTLNNVASRQKNYGCIYCMGGKVKVSKAVAMMISVGAQPLAPYTGKDDPWLCKCEKCGREITPTYGNVKRGQGPCKFCADHGLSLDNPAYLYILNHPLHRALKVGIGTETTVKKLDRVENLKRDGWILLRKYQYQTGLEAVEAETAIFFELRKVRKIPQYLSAAEMKKTAGHTETMDVERISEIELIKLVEEIIKSLKEKSLGMKS